MPKKNYVLEYVEKNSSLVITKIFMTTFSVHEMLEIVIFVELLYIAALDRPHQLKKAPKSFRG